MTRLSNYIFPGAGVLCAYLGGAVLTYGLVLFCWQVIHWLRFAVWVPLDFYSLFTVRAPDGYSPRWAIPDFVGSMRWLSHPDSWLGLHRAAEVVLGLIPLPLGLFLGGPILWLFGKDLEHKEDEIQKAAMRRKLDYD